MQDPELKALFQKQAKSASDVMNQLGTTLDFGSGGCI